MTKLYEAPATLTGFRVIETPSMVHTIQDWSRVRSPARARRRMKRGYAQNVVTRTVPRDDVVVHNETMYVHPATMMKLREQLELKK